MCNGSVGNYSLQWWHTDQTVVCQYQFSSLPFFFSLGAGLVASYHIPSFTQYKTGCGLNHDVCVCYLNEPNVFLC